MIGAGAASEVWAAQCMQTGEPVALKRLRTDATQQDVQRLRAEAGLLASFSSPNVISLRGVRSDDAGLVLVLERAALSLTELLEVHGLLNAGHVVGLLAPIADALGQAHARGILHGDISPGNILLRADGVPLLADLGTARLLALCGASSSPAAGSGIYGTPGFIDPTLRHGEPFAAASDVYALAAVAACALVGERLSDTPEGVQDWANHSHQLGVPPGLAAAICTLLVSPPACRPTAVEFAAALRNACPAVGLLPAEVCAPPTPRLGAPDVSTGPRVRAGDATRRIRGADRATDLAGTQRHCAVLAFRQRGTALLRGIAILLLIVGVGLGGGLVVTALGREDAVPPAANRNAPRASADVAADHWRGVLDHLDSERARAFAVLDGKLLEGVYAPTSPMLRADREQLARLQRLDRVAIDVRHSFRAVHVFRQTDGEVLIQASEQLQTHRIVQLAAATGRDESGEGAVRTVPTSAPRTVQISLIPVDGKWRINAVTPV